MISFVFAYFYLRAQDPDKDWKIGHVKPSVGFGLIILLVLVASAVLLAVAARRPALTVSAGGAALVLAFLSVVLQVIDWTTLGLWARERRLCQRLRRLDRVLFGHHPGLRLLDRDAGGHRVAPGP